MNYDFSLVKKPIAPATVALRTVYVLEADRSYDVKKFGTPYNDLIALRTTSGMGSVKIDGYDEISVLPNTLLFFKHSTVQRYYCKGEHWNFWWFEFSSNETLYLSLNSILQIGIVENEISECNSCLELLRNDNADSSCIASAHFILLLYKWMNHFEKKHISTSPHHHSIQKALDYIAQNWGTNVSIKTLANLTGLCERRFRQIFTDITGLSPKKYIEVLRINLAEELLRNTPFSIYEISERLGYSSQFHFSKAFFKSHKMSPTLFRKNI